MKFLFEWRLALGLPRPGMSNPLGLPELDLSPTARHVGRVLSEHMDADGGKCRPSGALIAQESGYAASTVWKALDELEAAGFVDRFATTHKQRFKGGRNTPTVYVPTIPETIRQADSFRALTVRRTSRNRPSESKKPSDSRTGGLRGLKEDGAAPPVGGRPVDDCMGSCGRKVALNDVGDGMLLCDDCARAAA